MLRLTALLFILSIAPVKSQDQEAPSPAIMGGGELEIAATINQLFAGMQSADTSGMATLFHPDARLNTVGVLDGKPVVRETPIRQFVASLAGAQPGDFLEELSHIEIRQDGLLATAWTPYKFSYQGQFSHCGVNTFQLVKTGPEDGWQIIQITDTRRREGCEELQVDGFAKAIEELADAWHLAAAEADGDAYFEMMAGHAIFIGTDATEHWTKAEFYDFAKPYFDDGKAWDFTAIERHIFFTPGKQTAYWDELLNTWMGPCRGTGIAEKQADGSWKIAHYTLSVTIDNDKIEGFIALTKKED